MMMAKSDGDPVESHSSLHQGHDESASYDMPSRDDTPGHGRDLATGADSATEPFPVLIPAPGGEHLQVDGNDLGTRSETSSVIPTSARLSISTLEPVDDSVLAPGPNEQASSAQDLQTDHPSPGHVNALLESILSNPAWNIGDRGSQSPRPHVLEHDDEADHGEQTQRLDEKKLPEGRRQSIFSMKSTVPTLPPYEGSRLPEFRSGPSSSTQAHFPDDVKEHYWDEAVSEAGPSQYRTSKAAPHRKTSRRKMRLKNSPDKSHLTAETPASSVSMRSSQVSPKGKSVRRFHDSHLAKSPLPRSRSSSHSSCSTASSTSSANRSTTSHKYNALSAHYSSIVRHLDVRFNEQLSHMRNDIDTAYRDELRQRTAELEREKELVAVAAAAAQLEVNEAREECRLEIATIIEQSKVEVERERCAVEEVWETRWRDRFSLIQDEEVQDARKSRDVEWLQFLQQVAEVEDGAFIDAKLLLERARKEMLGMEGDQVLQS